ncbi:MAG: phospho-sugar mutase, partial [Frankiales bacterium]|nr:phospho-sugar mutase [Frankiales bacterium]
MTLYDDVRAWIADDPDAVTRAELEALLEAGADQALADRFSGPLHFGTAGLRGPVRGGPNGMNRVVVRRTAAGLAEHLGPGT